MKHSKLSCCFVVNTWPELWVIRNRQLKRRVEDLRATLDMAEKWNSDAGSIFHSKLLSSTVNSITTTWRRRKRKREPYLDKTNLMFLLDAFNLDKVVAIGHSFGGVSCLGLLLEQEPRIKAVVSLDGWMFPLKGSMGPVFNETLSPSFPFERAPPVLFIDAEDWKGNEKYFQKNKARIAQLTELSGGRWKSITIKGTGHHNFNDFPFYSPVVSRKLGLIRELGLKQSYKITTSLMNKFLRDTGILGDEESKWTNPWPCLTSYNIIKHKLFIDFFTSICHLRRYTLLHWWSSLIIQAIQEVCARLLFLQEHPLLNSSIIPFLLLWSINKA